MVSYGYTYGGGLLAGGALAAWLTGSPWWAVPFVLLAAFCLNFFRDPHRDIPSGPVCVSPADGKVVALRDLPDGRRRVSIFLNVFDVHVNRSPIAGTIRSVEYRKGRFKVASAEEATAGNEQNVVTVAGDGTTVVFSQIAGLIARRILFYKKPGDPVAAGERVGLMKFGSRIDLFLGPEWDILVREGQRVRAGSGVVARRKE